MPTRKPKEIMELKRMTGKIKNSQEGFKTDTIRRQVQEKKMNEFKDKSTMIVKLNEEQALGKEQLYETPQ